MMISEALNSHELNLRFLRRLVADLDERQMVQQPENIPNHPAWVIGHLAYSCQQLGGEFGTAPWLPKDWGLRFGTGSTPTADPQGYPGRDSLLHTLHESHQRLAAVLTTRGEAVLAEPLPDERYRDRLPTIGHAVLHILASHTALHISQLTVWRRAMKLPQISEPLNS